MDVHPVGDHLEGNILQFLDLRFNARAAPLVRIAGGLFLVVVAEYIGPVGVGECTQKAEGLVDRYISRLQRHVDETIGDLHQDIGQFL